MKKFLILAVLIFFSCQPSVIVIALFSESPNILEKYTKGVKFAIETLNSEGGIGGHNLQLVVCKNGVDEAEQKKISALFLGPSSKNNIKKAVQLSEKNSIPLFFLFPYFKGGGNSLFLLGDIISETSFLSDAASYSLHSNFVLVIEFDKSLANCFVETFKKNGGKIEKLNCLELSSDEIKKKLKEIFCQNETPQIIFFAGFEKENIEPFKNFFQKSVVMAPFSYYVLNNFVSYERTLTTIPWFDLNKKTGRISEFRTNYENKYGRKVENFSSLGYEAVFLLRDLLNQKTKVQAMGKEIKKYNPFELELSGKFFFDGYGVLDRRLAFAVAKGGEIMDLSLVEREILKEIQEKVVMKRIKK